MLPPAYSALPSRNLPSLPHRARVAVYVVMNIEHFTFGKLGTAIQPHLTSSPEIANYGWRDYGNRVGIWRLFELFAELGIPVTAALNAEMVDLYPHHRRDPPIRLVGAGPRLEQLHRPQRPGP